MRSGLSVGQGAVKAKTKVKFRKLRKGSQPAEKVGVNSSAEAVLWVEGRSRQIDKARDVCTGRSIGLGEHSNDAQVQPGRS